MQNYYSIPEFAGLLRQTYPDLFTDIDDDQFIVRNWLSTYPDFLENINEDDLYEMFPEHQPPVAAQTYERYGQGAVAPFWDRVGHGLKGMGVDVVAAASDIVGVDGARDWAKGKNHEWMRSDPSLQAYMLWREDEPVSMDNFMDRDLIMRGLSEMLPSYIAMTGAAAAGYVASIPLIASGALAAGSTALATGFSMATIGTLEASGEYMQARDILEEKGVEESEAKITAGLASLTYGIIAGFLESLPFFHAVRNVPGLRSVVRKGMHDKLMTSLTQKAFSKGLGSESFWLKWASRAGRFGTEALDGMFTEAVTEGLQGLSQEVINWGLENGFGKTPEEVMQNIRKATSETYKSQEIIEQMYGGAIGGGIFSGIGGATPTLSRTSKDQADAIADQVSDTKEKILEDIEQRVAEPVSIERQAEMMVEAQEEYGVSENVEQVEQELFRLNAAARALGFDGIKHLNLNWDTPNAQGEEAQQLLKDHGALSNFIGENLSPEEVAQISKGSGLIQNWEWQRSGDKPIVKKGNIEKILNEIRYWIASGDDIVNPDSDSFRPYTNVVWSKDEKKNAAVKKQIDDLIAAAAPSVTEPFVAEKEGAGDFTAVGFLGSLAVSAPIYSYGSQELSTNPVAAAAEATKDIESFYEKGIRFIQELGDTSAIQKLPDDVRVSYLHGIGRWLKEVGILPEAAAINGNEIRQILELFAKGDAKIETVIQELEEGETGSIKQLQVKKSKATGLVKNIQNMSEGIIYTKEDWAELNIQSMAEEAAVTPEPIAPEPVTTPAPTNIQDVVTPPIEGPVPEAPPVQEDVSATAQQVEIEQKMEMMPVGSQVIVTHPKYKNKPAVIKKIAASGLRSATVEIEGVGEVGMAWNWIEPSAVKTPTTIAEAAEKPVTPAGIKTKDFRTMTEGKKEAAVQGDKSAQAEWAVEEVSEFYSAVEGGNISEIREEAMGLLRLAQHWPDNADVRLTVRKVIKDINKVFPTKESFNEAFDKWKAAKIKKGQAQEGVYVEDLKKTLEEIGKGIFKEKSTAPVAPTVPPTVKRQKLIKRRDLKANPDVQYLFGDNLAEKGKGGQAKEMRGEPNAIGIPTKKRPSMGKDAFFTDKELAANKKAIDKAFAKIDRSKPVVIPSAGLGTGLAGLKSKAPKTFEYLESKIAELESPIEEVHPAIIAERKRLFDEWYAKQEKATFRNLLDMAKEHKIPGRSKMNRAQLLKALKNIPPTKLLEEIVDLGDEGQAVLDKLIKDWEAKQEKAPAVPPLTLEDIDNELRPDPKRTVAAIIKAHEGKFTKSQAKSVYDSTRKRYAKFKKDPIAYLKAEIKQKEDDLKKGTYKKTNTKKYVQERLAQEKALLKNLEGAPTAESPIMAKTTIKFTETKKAGYPARTQATGQAADLTIDFAKTGRGSGATKKHAKKYHKVSVNTYGKVSFIANTERAREEAAEILATGGILNVAGHGIYNIDATQEQIDRNVGQFFDKIVETIQSARFLEMSGRKITGKVITGGQTGFDEAAAKAAMRLGIPVEVIAPKGWKFRDKSGNQSGKAKFQARFQVPTAPAAPVAAPAKSRTLAVSFGMLTGARVTVDSEGKILEIDDPPSSPTPPGMDLVGMYLDDLGYTADQVARITEQIKTAPAVSPPKTESTEKEISREEAVAEFREEAAKSKKQKVNKKKSDLRKEIDKRKSSSSRDDDNTSAFVDVGHPKRKKRSIFLLEGDNKSETRKIRKIIFNRLKKKMPFIKPFGSGFVVNASELSDGVLGESLGNLVQWANTTVEGDEASLEIIPHEYFHAYWRLLGETSPLVRQALKEYGAEAIEWVSGIDKYKHLKSDEFEAVGEYIAHAVGRLYAHKAVTSYTPSKNVIQKIKLWLERMWRKLRSMVRPSSLTKDDVVKLVAEQFYDDAPMEMGTRGASISKEVRKRYRNKYSKERMNALKAMRARNSAALFAVESADYSSEKEDESETNYEDWALGSEQDADFEYKKFLETGMRVWGVPVTREEFNNIVATAKTIESNPRLSVKDKRNAFRQYILEGTWAPKEKQSRVLAKNKSLRDQGKTASTFLRNIIQRVYVQANNTIDRASKVFLEINNGTIDVQKGETVTGRKLSKHVRKSFLDWMPIGKKTAYIKFSDINRSEVIEQKGKDDLTIWINEGSRWVESNFDKLEKQLADLQYALVGAKGGDQSTLFLVEIDDWIDTANNKKSIEVYFEVEQESGTLSQEDIFNFMHYGKKQEENNPNVWAQIIARHEWWKEVYGARYLGEQIDNPNYKGLQDELNRTRGPLAEGWLPLGWTKDKGTYNTVLVDPSEVEMRMIVDGKEKVISMEEDFLGVGKKRYRLDGFMAIDTESMGNIADAIGRRPEKGERLTEFKPYIYHNGATGMVIEKMNMSEAPVGLTIVNKKTKAPIISVRESNGRTEYYFHNQDGTETRINSWASREEAKKSSGTFNQTNTVLELPESSLTVISAGDETGKRSVAFPMNWMDLALSSDLLADKNFLAGYKIIAKWLLNNAKQNIRNIVKMRSNPSKLRAALMEIGVIQDKATTLEKELIREIEAAALLHPAFMKRHAGSILNLYMKQYAFKGRKDGNGSYVVMAPDFADEMADDEIIYGDANRTLVRLTAQEAYDTVEEFQDFWSRYRKTREREGAINELNAILSTKEILHMRSHQPVVNIQALALRRVKRIEYDGGNRVFVNAIDTFKWLQGDFDGDHLQVQVLGERELQGMKLMLNSKAVKNRDRSTRLELFQHSDFKGSLSSFSDMKNIFSKISTAHSSQGIINNAKQIRELLVFKNLRTNWEIEGESVEVEMIPSDEVVTLDYAPLDKSIVSRLDIYKSLKNEGIEVVNEAGESLTVKTIKATDGPVFLRTTSAHEASILLQASVDNVKEMLLPEWGYNGYDFMIRRMVRRTDGQPLTEFQVNVYNRDIFNAFKYSALRRGREMGGGGRTLNMMELYAYSKNHEGYNTTTVEDIDKVTKQRMKKGSIKDSAKNYLVARLRPDSKTSKADKHKFLSVTMDTMNEASGMKAQSLFEDMMPILYREIEAHLERHPNDAIPAGDVFSLSNVSSQNAHHAAINAFNKTSPILAAELGLKPLSKEELKRVRLLTSKMTSEYYNIFINKEYQDKHGNTYTMGDRFVTKYEYSEALGAFIDEWLPKLRAESDVFRYMSTVHFLNGVMAITNKKGKSRKRDIRTIENVYMLLPFELMEKPALLEYFRLWGENLFKVSAVKPNVKKDKETWNARTSKYEKEYQKSVCK